MTTSVADRFYKHVHPEPNTGCHLWGGQLNEKGYGRFSLTHTRRVFAHRMAWELVNGPIPVGMCVLHACDNPACVNPQHLYLGTRVENNEDMTTKRRGHKGPLPYGVRRSGKRFGAQVVKNKRTYWGGTFDTPEEAALVAEKLRAQLWAAC